MPGGDKDGGSEQCPSLVTKRWRGGKDKRGEQETLPPRTRLLDVVVMVSGGFQAGQHGMREDSEIRKNKNIFNVTTNMFKEEINSYDEAVILSGISLSFKTVLLVRFFSQMQNALV